MKKKKKKVIHMFHLGIEYFKININRFRILEFRICCKNYDYFIQFLFQLIMVRFLY